VIEVKTKQISIKFCGTDCLYISLGNKNGIDSAPVKFVDKREGCNTAECRMYSGITNDSSASVL
jgi:hypothetical protein